MPMKLSIIAQNLQGLNDDAFTNVVHNYYSNHIININVLCFQEHKLKGEKLTRLKDKIWRRAKFFAIEANIAYNNQPDETCSRK